MAKLHFPLLSDKDSVYPHSDSKCTWCERVAVSEPNTFVALEGGCYSDNVKSRTFKGQDLREAFFTLWFHGAHDGGTGERPGTQAIVPVADGVIGGRFAITFCGLDCLRSFLNYLVDELERRIE